jgi:D-methionine transport system permease protein
MSLDLLIKASLETIAMVLTSAACAALIGIPLGFALFMYGRNKETAQPALYQTLAFIVNASRSVPFIILMVAIIPFTRLIVGTSIGTVAAMVPLTIAAVPFLARLVESALMAIPPGLIEASESMGANSRQLICYILWPEALPGIIDALTVMLVSLVGYSAMAGAIGGGGLGDLAIRFGYQRFDATVMIITVVILIIMVQGLQSLGEFAAKLARRGR